MADLRGKNKHTKRNTRPSASAPGSAPTREQTLSGNRPADNRKADDANRKTGRHVTGSDISDNMKGAKEVDADKRIAVYIAVLAVLLAICTTGGDNASKDTTRTNILASDTWAHFQAKRLRETSYRLASETLELRLISEPNMPEEARKQVQEKIAEYRAEAERLKSDPKKGEGQAELAAKAKGYEADRNVALRRDPYFDYATAFLQIAIVLASAAIVFGGEGILMTGSIVIGALGVGLMVNGFTLLVNVPFIG
jgi:hypothetical protein